ncbi:MAG: hypothetical protein IPP68_00235 [Elusimicrobia bacterium]|nr:hypothetical protein [Elusimicrobiota bacterium]
MNLKSIRTVFYLFGTLFLLGCATSRYHLGYNYSEGRTEARMRVAKIVDGETLALEGRCVKAFLNFDLSPIIPMFAPKLKAKMTPAEINSLIAKLKTRYEFSGSVLQIDLTQDAPRTIPYSGDNFDRFDYIESVYILKGRPGAALKLQLTKIGGELKLCGFVVISETNDPNPDKKALNYFFSETDDKDGAFQDPSTSYN